jgi:hypothetical protein
VRFEQPNTDAQRLGAFLQVWDCHFRDQVGFVSASTRGPKGKNTQAEEIEPIPYMNA